MNATTLQDARTELASTISFAQIALQGVAQGSDAYAAVAQAITDGQQTLGWLADNAGIIPPNLADAPNTRDKIAAAIDEINGAVADNVKQDPAAALFKTIFPSVSPGSPWPWIAGGAAVLVGAWWFFRGEL